MLDFFSSDGIQWPDPSALPKDVWHVALAVATREEALRFKARFDREGVSSWVETHEKDDVHVYATDPNGVTLEILATQDGNRDRGGSRPAEARRVVEQWLASHPGA